MTLPSTPEGWGIRITQLLKAGFRKEYFPVTAETIKMVAMEYSRQVFPEEPITLVQGDELSKGIEGMLLPNPNKQGEWGIIYNTKVSSTGRINFTLAHEFGHYLMHRKHSLEGIRCFSRDMMDWRSEEAKIEGEANTFASFLLMPLDDFREQIDRQRISLALMQHLANRYGVSVSAAILKWLSITDKRAMIVVGKEGFIDWAWSSKNLLKSGISYRARQEVIELPQHSLAARNDASINNIAGVVHPKGIWIGNEAVHEMTILAKQGDMAISLLIYSDYEPRYFASDEDELSQSDSYDKMLNLK